MASTTTCRVLAACIALTLGPRAHASGPDYFGIGGKWQGMGGGGVAVVDDGTASMLNPAGLARIRRPLAGIAVQSAHPNFAEVPELWWDTNRDGVVDENDPPLQYSADPRSVTSLQIHLGRHVGGKFGLGLTAHVPFDTLVRFKTFEPSLPNYPLWDNRLERFALAAGVGGEIAPGIAVGAGVDALAAARLTVLLTADVGISGGSTGTTTTGGNGIDNLVTEAVIDLHEIDFQIVPAFAPVVGVQWDVGELVPPLHGLVLGAAYHGEVGLPIDLELDLQANVDLQDFGSLDPFVTSIVADATLLLFDHYVPRSVKLGLAWRRSDTFTVYGDFRWTDWSRMRLNIAQLTEASLTSPLIGLDDAIVDGNQYIVDLRSTWGYRQGVDLQLPEWTLDSDWRYVRLRVRGGFGIEPSPLRGQTVDTSMLDAGRTWFTLGTGVETWDPLELTDGPLALDVFFQYHVLNSGVLDRRTAEPRAGYPRGQGGIPFGGDIVVLGGEWSFEY